MSAGLAMALLLPIGTLLPAPLAHADTSCPTPSTTYASGDGTTTPFTLETKEQLQRLKVTSADWDKKFQLAENIDMGGCIWSSPIGTQDTPFTGTFSGVDRSLTISGLSVVVDTPAPGGGAQNSGFAGLFGVVGPGHLLEKFVFEGSVANNAATDRSAVNAGGIAGSAKEGRISQVTFRGAVTASVSVDSTRFARAGGLVGVVEGFQTIEKSLVTQADVIASGTDPTSGGLVGRQSTIDTVTLTIISSAAAETNVTARDQYSSGGSVAGGLVGEANGIVTATDSYATGVIRLVKPLNTFRVAMGGLLGYANKPASLTRTFASTSLFVIDPQIGTSPSIGGLAGSMANDPLTGNFWDGTAAFPYTRAIGNQPESEDVGRRTSFEMQSPATFTAAGWSLSEGFSSSSTWGMCSAVNSGYPFLTTFYSNSPCPSPDPSQVPPSWYQSVGRMSAEEACPAGWNPSWAQWMHDGLGGFVCNREIYWNINTDGWASRAMQLP